MAENKQNDITFLDVACLLKITPETTLEKLGGVLNSSIFDAANIAGTLKQKGLIEFSAAFPGPTGLEITDAGKALINELNAKITEPTDALDEEILRQLSGGKRLPVELQNTLSLAPRDLAFRLYKLSKQNLIVYEVKNGGVELMLTEQGFLKTKTAQAQPQAQAQAQQAQATPGQTTQPIEQAGIAAEVGAQQAQPQSATTEQTVQGPKPSAGKKIVSITLLVIAIIIIVAVLFMKHII